MAARDEGIIVDDFIVAVGIKQSNSVYRVAEVRIKNYPKKRMARYHVKCFKSDLIIALRRDQSQKLIPIKWYKRIKKTKDGNTKY